MVDDGFELAMSVKELIDYGTVVKDNSPTKPKSNKTYNYNYCKLHPKYAAIRFPVNGCEVCQAAYKKLHPLEYDQKFAAWQRKQKASAT